MASTMVRVFDMPELTVMIGSFLEHKDLSSYMHTCRTFHTLCAPSLFQVIDLRRNQATLFQSTACLKALVRNIHSVRNITISRVFLDHYYSASTTLISDLKPYDSNTCPPMDTLFANLYSKPLLPPMANLTDLDYMSFKQCCCHEDNFQDCFRDGEGDATRISHLVRQSPHLRNIRVNEVFIRDRDKLHLLTRTISGCAGLKPYNHLLQLSRVGRSVEGQSAPMGYGSGSGCSDSPTILSEQHGGLEQPRRFFDAGAAAGSSMQSVRAYSYWQLVPPDGGLVRHTRELSQNHQSRAGWSPKAGQCGSRRRLCYRTLSKPPERGPTRVLSRQQCLGRDSVGRSNGGWHPEYFVFTGMYDQDNRVLPTLQRHFKSLNCVQLNSCGILSSAAIQAILVNCSHLWMFEATGLNLQENHIRLQNAATVVM
ncbi:hypothetical protein BGX29_003681 [Mortierella sp. GBA35]|nr:hypothetical protein BGX29_003681 [Mortierella sp. GBA35]